MAFYFIQEDLFRQTANEQKSKCRKSLSQHYKEYNETKAEGHRYGGLLLCTEIYSFKGEKAHGFKRGFSRP